MTYQQACPDNSQSGIADDFWQTAGKLDLSRD
jgi:hypothetical protein